MSKPIPQQTVPLSGDLSSWRNRAAWRIANWALNRVATPQYRDIIGALIKIGIDEAYGPKARTNFSRRAVRY